MDFFHLLSPLRLAAAMAEEMSSPNRENEEKKKKKGKVSDGSRKEEEEEEKEKEKEGARNGVAGYFALFMPLRD